LEIEYVAVEKLIPYAKNSRTHSDAQVAQIAASIREFGFTNPVLVDGEDGIIAGHGRVLAARKLEMDSLPCIRLPHLTDVQRRAYVIADNKLALNAGWDDELLKLELDLLDDKSFDLSIMGFSISEIEGMFGAPVDIDGVDEITTECTVVITCSDYGEQQIAIGRLGGKKITWLTLEGMLSK
jgi:ParB-like chromosome segregation protein Spo0J